MITAEEVRHFFNYNPETGAFTWRVAKGYRIKPGTPCNYVNKSGKNGQHKRIKIRFNNKLYAAHRLAWLYVYGEWPDGHIDHINRNPLDNRISNLRIATHAQNAANSKHPKGRNKYRGVYYFKNGWMAQLSHKGRSYYIGRFRTEEDARQAWLKKAKELRGEFAHDK